MGRERVERVAKKCAVCGIDFLVGGRAGALTKEYCSKSCATAGAHRKERARGTPRKPYANYTSPQVAATEHPTVRVIAWAAGFYEGEGSCQGVIGTLQKHSTRCHIGQKNRWPLDRMVALFGGRISEGSCNNAPFYDWQISGARARGFLMTIYSFLSPRRQEQVRAAVGMREAA
jgi:hypothetical protein